MASIDYNYYMGGVATDSKDKSYRHYRLCLARGVQSYVRYMCYKCPSQPVLCLDNGCFELHHTKDYLELEME